MRNKLIIVVIAMLASTPALAQWSEYPACSKQYDADKAACNKMKTNDNAKKRSCWASASERLAYCGKHKGKTGFPALLNK